MVGRWCWTCRTCTQPAYALVLSARSSEQETVQCAGEILEGFLEESLGSSIKAGSDLDREYERGDSVAEVREI